MNNLFQNTGIRIDYDHQVVVKEWDYFYNLAVLLHNTPTETLGKPKSFIRIFDKISVYFIRGIQ